MTRTCILLSATCCLVLAALMPARVHASGSVEGMILTASNIPASFGRFSSSVRTGDAGLAAMGATDVNTMKAQGVQTAAVSILSPKTKTNAIRFILNGVSRYASSGGAHVILQKDKQILKKTSAHLVPLKLGAEGFTRTVSSQGGKFHATQMFWRRGRYVSEVEVEFAGKAQTARALKLARITDGRIPRTG